MVHRSGQPHERLASGGLEAAGRGFSAPLGQVRLPLGEHAAHQAFRLRASATHRRRRPHVQLLRPALARVGLVWRQHSRCQARSVDSPEQGACLQGSLGGRSTSKPPSATGSSPAIGRRVAAKLAMETPPGCRQSGSAVGWPDSQSHLFGMRGRVLALSGGLRNTSPPRLRDRREPEQVRRRSTQHQQGSTTRGARQLPHLR
mmetsp:Transcript_56957/g.123297  ORF Transcript_56957/g.123297 Transcript_56957/m.123297 type:complete len:202 (-) Transcript_56957:352-957(-)